MEPFAGIRIDGGKNLTIIMVMPRKQPFVLIYASETKDHLRAIKPRHHSLIGQTIESQLRYEPDVETRNRKPLTRPISFGATWELRLGSQNQFRVFYDIDLSVREVHILMIGVKVGNVLYFGGQEFEE